MVDTQLLILFAILGVLIGAIYALRRIFAIEKTILRMEGVILRVEKLQAMKKKKK